MMPALLVAIGGALGSLARFWLALAIPAWPVEGFPAGTLLINTLGSLVIGVMAALPAGEAWRAFVMVGLCGGFTTFSAFSLQTVLLARAGALGWAAAYVGLSVGVCVLATLAGLDLGQRLAATLR